MIDLFALDQRNKQRFPNINVNLYDYVEYVCAARDNLKFSFSEQLEEQLGIYLEPLRKGPPLGPKLRNLFKALAGPHGRTVLKIYQVNKEVTDGTDR